MAEYKLLTVLFKQNNPYGGYVTGDSVQVFYSDTTLGFKVYKNGVISTSGNNIPAVFVYNGKDNNYYKSEDLEQVSICVTTSKLKYQRQGAFPYLTSELLANHPTCNIPVVCDLQFTNLPVVTNASSATSNDGSVTISATSSNGSIQYALNRDFAYGFGQTSTTFNNLGPGTYTVYARDSVNCRATITFNVGVALSYGTIFRCEFVTPQGDTHKTEIKQKGYSGAITDVEGGIPPTIYRLRGEGERDKFVTLLAGEMECSLIAETEGTFQTIYTNDPEKFRMVHSINNSPVWTGKVLTNQYEESYVNTPYPVTIVASDSLPLLNDIPFLDDYGNRLSGDIKQIVLIAFILKKLNLGLSIRSGLNIYAESMNKNAADDPLDQAYVDVSRYYQLQNNPTCGDVLNWLLEPYNAQIIQWNNYWNIIRIEERINNFDYRQYDANGTYVSNSTYAPVKELKNSSYSNRMVWANQNQRLRIMPGYGSIRLLYDLGNRKNIYKNGDFKLTSRLNWDAYIGDESVQLVPDLNGFQIINDPVYPVLVSYENLEENNIAVSFTATGPGGSYLLSDVVNLKMGTVDKLRINIRFKLSRNRLDDPNILFDFRYIRVRFMIRYGDYYLNDQGAWLTSEQIIIAYVDRDKANEYIDYEIICNAPLDNVTLTPSVDYLNGKSFEIKIYFPNANEATYNESTTAASIAKLKDKLTTSLPEGFRTELYDVTGTYTPGGFIGNYIFYYELKEDNNDESFPDIIRPDDYNSTTNPVQWILQGIQKYDNSIKTTITIDKIVAEILGQGRPLPDFETLEQDMENENPVPIQKQIVHGSLGTIGKTLTSYGINIGFGIDVTGQNNSVIQFYDNVWLNKVDYIANAADLAYNGYLRNNSGVGYDKWARTAFAESKTLQQIFMDVYSSQYNQPWRMLSGDMYSEDTFFSPIDTLKETIDNNRLYIPTSLTIDFYANVYNCEFLELFDLDDNAAVGFSEGFTTGFNS